MKTSAIAHGLLPLLGLLSIAARSQDAAAQAYTRDERIARNIEIGRRYFNEVWNQGDVTVLDQLLAPSYINHTPSTPNPPPGPAGLKPIVLAMRSAFPDLHYEIKDVIATEDAVVMRVVMNGTHRGVLFGLPATGKKVSVEQINIEHLRDGRIVEHWRVTDELELMRQLGAVP
ncbi:ester cyclase [Peristeroidobacter agariperforans]|uniref:ester cyclase n=1 Tax=Peristeroidobacter agariperforans TaxID=268404 RepID=UPI00130075B0|nr:ester cyclase [Peristeroidobacter agariperforans]